MKKIETQNSGDVARRINEWDELSDLSMSESLEKYPPTGRLKEIIDHFNAELAETKAERARSEAEEARLEKAEAKRAFLDVAKSAAALAAVGITLISSLIWVDSKLNAGPSNLEEQNYYDRLRSVEVSSVTFTGSPNLRSQPHVTDNNDFSNSYGSVREDSATIEVNGTMYILDGLDANGPWYGLPAAEAATGLESEGYISKTEASNIAKDTDGVLWVSGNYVDYEKAVD